jgi:hypothetical protein
MTCSVGMNRIVKRTFFRKITSSIGRTRTLLNELDAIAWGEKPRRSYAEAEEKFIKEHLTAIKPRAAQRYGVSLKHLAEHFGDKMLHQITSAALSDFDTKRRMQGVSLLVTSCVDWEWIDSNPVPPYLRRRAKRRLVDSRRAHPEHAISQRASLGPTERLRRHHSGWQGHVARQHHRLAFKSGNLASSSCLNISSTSL